MSFPAAIGFRLRITAAAVGLATLLAAAPAPAKGPGSDKDWGNNHNTVVHTTHGKLRGYVDGRTLVWKGVPYAKPPVGALRWRAPQPPEPWRGVRDASEPAEPCTQLHTTTEWIRTGAAIGSEDCLYVDIYRPRRPAYHREQLPVYVWIHGGSNNFGSALQYDGRALAERSNVVVVMVQYRLGPLGWFLHPAVQTNGADRLSDSGNFGTLDHVRALTWIKHNIAAFGGDPSNVTITGESAGAHNVMNMVVSPLGKGLFHKAMSQSGGMTTKPVAYARELANNTVEQLIRYTEGVDAATATARRLQMEADGMLGDYLRAADAGDLFLAILTVGGSIGTYDGIEDGTVLPVGGWMPAIRAGVYNKVPIILGANEYESKPFMPLYGPTVKALTGQPSGPYSWFNLMDVMKGRLKPDGTPLTLADVLPTQADRDVYEYAGYFGGRNWRAKFVDTVAHELVRVQDDVYAYDFRWGGIGSGPAPFDFIYGAGHSAEIQFFFGDEQGLFGYPFVPENEAGRRELQAAMMAYLAQFVRTGNPNGARTCGFDRGCLPLWQAWSPQPGGPKVIVFDGDFQQARIAMETEELTIEGVDAAREAAIAGMTPAQQAAVRFFRFSSAW